jgi:hypothetical protein
MEWAKTRTIIHNDGCYHVRNLARFSRGPILYTVRRVSRAAHFFERSPNLWPDMMLRTVKHCTINFTAGIVCWGVLCYYISLFSYLRRWMGKYWRWHLAATKSQSDNPEPHSALGTVARRCCLLKLERPLLEARTAGEPLKHERKILNTYMDWCLMLSYGEVSLLRQGLNFL